MGSCKSTPKCTRETMTIPLHLECTKLCRRIYGSLQTNMTPYFRSRVCNSIKFQMLHLSICVTLARSQELRNPGPSVLTWMWQRLSGQLHENIFGG
ncbi:hypothetical protein J6590_069191 [Homalodisca vitripennis]|nr:hypothetical protein J6590_069191 [Homalodisca vitripennis]